MSHDAFSQYDAAYVLGALPPGERQEFESHLHRCDSCTQAVAEVAGLPGLLARVDPRDLEPDDGNRVGAGPADALPETLLPRLLAEVAKSSRRRRTRSLALGAAAATVVAAVSVGVTAGVRDGSGPSSPAPVAQGIAMTQVHQTVLSARVAMEEVAWGTRLRITCTYEAAAAYGDAETPAYALVVYRRDGSEDQVATWRAVAGRPTTIVAATASRRSEITSVEVRTTAGEPVLRLAG